MIFHLIIEYLLALPVGLFIKLLTSALCSYYLRNSRVSTALAVCQLSLKIKVQTATGYLLPLLSVC